MEPRLRNILWDASGAPIRRSEPFDTSTIITSSTIPLHQLLEPLPSLAIDPALEHIVSEARREGTTNVERTRLQPLVDWLNDSDWPASRDLDPDNVVLPPIQQQYGVALESNAAAGQSGRAQKSGAPLAEVLNAMSPLVAARDVETLRIKDLRLIVETSGNSSNAQGVDVDHGDDAMPNSKRRRVEAESTRTLPRPARKSTRRQKMPALPPLLAPLHNPPVDARVVPSMTTDGLPRMSEMKSPLPYPGAPAEREPDPDNQIQGPRQEDGLEEPKRGENSDLRKAVAKASQKKTADTLSKERQQKSSSKSKKETVKRVKWTTEETQYLIDGVERFGIGNWKKILECKDYQFKGGRNSIDLKDRFRTCFPDEYRRSGSQRGKIDSVLDSSGNRRGRGGRTRVELQRMGVDEHIPFPKQDRRQRNHFTKAEDDALLRGFLKYPAQWKKIQMDPSLGLQHRTRTDLRDRFRNRYPQRFKEAGYVHKAKQADPSAGTVAAEVEGDGISKDDDENTTPIGPANNLSTLPVRSTEVIDLQNLINAAANQSSTSILGALTSNSKDEPNHTLRLLAGGFNDNYNFSDMSIDDEDDDDSVAGIQLNRAIFDWADQNKINMAAAKSAASSALANAGSSNTNALRDSASKAVRIDPLILHANGNGASASNVNTSGGANAGDKITLSAIDQFHVNPLDVNDKLPGPASLIAGQAAAAPASVPLSRILNGG